MISIITPAFNRAHFLSELKNSILDQSNPNWEWLIIDDNSSDESIEIINRFCKEDNRIRLIHRDRKPKGANTCRNIGIEKANGDYLVFVDSDDLLLSNCVEQRLLAFEHNSKVDYHIFQTQKFSEETYNLDVWSREKEKDHLTQFLKLDSVWHTSGPVWKRASLKKHNQYFDENLSIWQDLDYHIQALVKGMTYEVHLDLPPDVLYRVHNNESISQQGYSYKHRKSQVYFLKKLEKILPTEKKSHIRLLHSKLLNRIIKQRYFDLALNLLVWKMTHP
ncbi:MAG TPA: hypothetical protein DDY13_08190 [Cytophagales bacterium]|nr:hypothetical protein [Cytophagales bacterium]